MNAQETSLAKGKLIEACKLAKDLLIEGKKKSNAPLGSKITDIQTGRRLLAWGEKKFWVETKI